MKHVVTDSNSNIIEIHDDTNYGYTPVTGSIPITDSEFDKIAKHPMGMRAFKLQGNKVVKNSARIAQEKLQEQKDAMIAHALAVAENEVIKKAVQKKAAPTIVKIRAAKDVAALNAIDVETDVKGNP